MSDQVREALNIMSDHIIGGALCYLATPYSKYHGGDIERAFVDAAKLTALLLRAGLKVYSPITHTHPLAIHGMLDPYDHSIWLPFDEAMMQACHVLLVAHMDGWQESFGIAHEIEFFGARGKPIYDLDPKTLTMARRTPQRLDHDRYENLTDAQIRERTNDFLGSNDRKSP